jgi:cyclic pyranopterin phosphate synthase
MPDNSELSHVSAEGRVRMVDVGHKQATERTARAEAIVHLGVQLTDRLKRTGSVEKGSVLETARIAGIMAAKQTASLIPLCHQIPLSVVDIKADLGSDSVRLESFVRCHHTTGVEMEAMTAVSVAALTVYDMCKAASKGITIERVRLLEKTGGKSGSWTPDGEAIAS